MKKILKKTIVLFVLAFMVSLLVPTAVSARKYYNPNKMLKKVPAAIRNTFIRDGGQIYKVKKIPGGHTGQTICQFYIFDYNDPHGFRVVGHIQLKKAVKGLVYHEFGHYMDYSLGTISADTISPMSDSPLWGKIFKKERKKYKPAISTMPRGYSISNRLEYFAQTMADFFTHPKKLKKRCPLTYRFLKNAVKQFRY